MKKCFKTSITWLIGILSFLFLFLSDDMFKLVKLIHNQNEALNVFVNKVLFAIIVFLVITLITFVIYKNQNSVIIRGRNYIIEVKFGDIFQQKTSKKVIPFDECFTSVVGDEPHNINSNSLCGQFLRFNPSIQIEQLLSKVDSYKKGKSEYMGLDRYETGRLIPMGDYLLMSFARLNKDGLGCLTFSEYLTGLSVLWDEIDKYYGQEDVCIPILGSGVTRFKDVDLEKQELLDIIIASYKVSRNKIHRPNKLIIVCSMDKIGENY